MKRYTLLPMLMLVLAFMACSSDETIPEQPTITKEMFKGEWYSEDNCTYLKMAYSSFQGVVYGQFDTFPMVGELLSGKWIYIAERNIIRMQTHYEKSSFKETRDYRVLRIDKYSMTLVDLNLNADYTYHKVIDSRELSLGEEFNIDVEGFTPSTYTPVSPLIVKVNQQGRVKARSTGTTYVRAESGGSSIFVKVDVGSRVLSYANELFGSIDDIIARYGTPDWTGPTDTPSMAIVYNKEINDARLKYLCYKYDENTREVSQIAIKFCEIEGYEEELNYLKANYYDFYGDSSVFMEDELILNNDYFIQIIIQDDPLILFNNMVYRYSHGYN